MSDVNDRREAYLNDHLAGAQGALDLLEGMQTSDDEHLAALAGELHREISEDRAQLEHIIGRLELSDERMKRVVASVAASTGRLARVGVPDPVMRLLELETVSGGVWMKQRLWQALMAAPQLQRELDDVDLEELSSRADRQLDRIAAEHHRLATEALDASPIPT